MPRRRPDDDLFADSTRSFGEHLEELRKALFLSVIGLLAGVLLGLSVAHLVVAFIQTPLQKALTRYYLSDAEHTVDTKIQELKTASPGPLPDIKVVKDHINEGYEPQIIYFDVEQLA
jgi:sec-independent protein translocase protein TatC